MPGISTTRLDDHATQFARAVIKASGLFDSPLLPLYAAIWRILTEGRPASAEEIATATGRPVDEVAAIIAAEELAEVDRHGRVLGVALTLIPTPHRVLLPGRDHLLYLWCVPDAFAVSKILDQPFRLISSCHATGREIVLEIEPDRVREADPDAAVIAFVTSLDPADIRGTGCVLQNLFASAEHAAPWLAGHPHAFVVPARDALTVMAPVIDAFTAGMHPGGTSSRAGAAAPANRGRL